MVLIENTTLICPKNDLESQTIVNIAMKLGMDVRVSEQGWGAQLGMEPPEVFQDLKENLIVVEMPDPDREEMLRKIGCNVIWIDHHTYLHKGQRLDRSHGLSSLEQFADIVGYALSDRKRLFALNDRGYIWAMARETTCTLDDIKKVRNEDLEPQGYTAEVLSASEKDYKERIDFTHFSLVTTKLDKIAYITQLHQMPTTDEFEQYRETGKEQDLPVRSILVLTLSSDRKNVVEVNFFGAWKYKQKFSHFLKDNGFNSTEFIIWEGGDKGKAFFWGGKRTANNAAVDDMADAILNILIGQDRPLLKFSTVFFYPFKVRDRTNNTGRWRRKFFDIDKPECYQEYIYFHPYVRDLLFQRKKNSLFDSKKKNKRDILPPIAYYEFRSQENGFVGGNLKIEYKSGSHNNASVETISYPVSHLAIHEFFNNIAIMAIQVTQEADEDIRKKPFWKQCIAIEGFRRDSLTCRDALKFNELARKIYLSFPEQFKEGKIPLSVKIELRSKKNSNGYTKVHTFSEDNFKYKEINPVKSEIIDGLVSEFLGYDEPVDKSFHGLLDDRMVVFTFLCFAGELKSKCRETIDEHEALFSRIMYVDQAGEGYAYQKKFIRKKMNNLVYRRWSNGGSLYGYTRYSSAYTGFGDFFGDKLFQDFNSMYYQLALISLYYRSSLISFSDEVAQTTQQLVNKKDQASDRELFLKLKADFMQFSNLYWFQEVTNQDQGIEIFKLYKKSFEFETMYKQIKEEIDRGDEYLNTLQQIELNVFTTNFSRYGLVLAGLAILVGFFGINFSFFGLENTWGLLLWCMLSIFSILFLICTLRSSIRRRKRESEQFLVSSFHRLKRWWANVKTRRE
ncbi:MAG: hypothetical protein LWX02_03525 [Deltaproteobacteria bacterium]|nr:hypothetical protein [Deltaproteobacteria bacterium]MDL1986813.1 hypothetical protein [Deltaproteobacteria bacterium]